MTMLKKIIIKAWKDPVGSKIISFLIIGLLTLISNLIWTRVENEPFKTVFIAFWTFKIELWIILIVIILTISIYSILIKRFRYDYDTFALDRKLFNTIRNWDGMSELIMEIKTNCFSTRPVEMRIIQTMNLIRSENEKPEFKFFNPRLDKIKDEIFKEFDNLDSLLYHYVFGANNGFVAIPSEWEYEQPERMNKAIKELKEQENIFTKKYQDFIDIGRKTLKI